MPAARPAKPVTHATPRVLFMRRMLVVRSVFSTFATEGATAMSEMSVALVPVFMDMLVNMAAPVAMAVPRSRHFPVVLLEFHKYFYEQIPQVLFLCAGKRREEHVRTFVPSVVPGGGFGFAFFRHGDDKAASVFRTAFAGDQAVPFKFRQQLTKRCGTDVQFFKQFPLVSWLPFAEQTQHMRLRVPHVPSGVVNPCHKPGSPVK